MPDFKEMLKYYREKKGISQAELACELGLSKSTISMYEVGAREPNFKTEEKIAYFFNIDLNTLRGKDTFSVTADEIAFLEEYRNLNAAGKKKILHYLKKLSAQK